MSVPGDGNGKTRTNHPFFATPLSYQSLPKRGIRLQLCEDCQSSGATVCVTALRFARIETALQPAFSCNSNRATVKSDAYQSVGGKSEAAPEPFR